MSDDSGLAGALWPPRNTHWQGPCCAVHVSFEMRQIWIWDWPLAITWINIRLKKHLRIGNKIYTLEFMFFWYTHPHTALVHYTAIYITYNNININVETKLVVVEIDYSNDFHFHWRCCKTTMKLLLTHCQLLQLMIQYNWQCQFWLYRILLIMIQELRSLTF